MRAGVAGVTVATIPRAMDTGLLALFLGASFILPSQHVSVPVRFHGWPLHVASSFLFVVISHVAQSKCFSAGTIPRPVVAYHVTMLFVPALWLS